MAVLFDFTQAYTIPTTPQIIGTITDQEIWRELFNPGHTGASEFVHIRFSFEIATSGATTVSYKFQYKALDANPAAWTDIATDSVALGAGGYVPADISEYILTTMNAPVMIRIIVSSTSATAGCCLIPDAANCQFRMVGTVE